MSHTSGGNLQLRQIKTSDLSGGLAADQLVTTPSSAQTRGQTLLWDANGSAVAGTDYSADTGAANAYVMTLATPPAAYYVGMEIAFKAANANTTASTVNVSSLGVVAITKGGTTALAGGEIAVNQIVKAIYDGTQFQGIGLQGTALTNPMTTIGDIIYGGASGVPTRLAAGTSGNVLQTNGAGAPTWVAPGGGGGGSSLYGVSGIITWLSGDNLTGLSDGNFVTTWPNLAISGSGYAAQAQATSTSNYPIYKTAILNGLPIVRFAGTGWYRVVSCTGEPAWTFFAVLKITSLANSYTAILKTSWFSDLTGYFIKSSGKSALYVNGASNYDGSGAVTMNNSTFYIISGVIGPQASSTQVALSADGSISGQNQSNSNTTNQVVIGNDYSNVNRSFTGDLAEFLVYNNALTSTQVTSVSNSLKTKYGL